MANKHNHHLYYMHLPTWTVAILVNHNHISQKRWKIEEKYWSCTFPLNSLTLSFISEFSNSRFSRIVAGLWELKSNPVRKYPIGEGCIYPFLFLVSLSFYLSLKTFHLYKKVVGIYGLCKCEKAKHNGKALFGKGKDTDSIPYITNQGEKKNCLNKPMVSLRQLPQLFCFKVCGTFTIE